MKHLKTFEVVRHLSDIKKTELEIGDYVVLKMWHNDNSELIKFVNSNIGEIVYLSSLAIDVTVEYENVPISINKYFNKSGDNKYNRTFHTNEIEYYSTDKEELEIAIAANKYNI
jgi:hypothetical protein